MLHTFSSVPGRTAFSFGELQNWPRLPSLHPCCVPLELELKSCPQQMPPKRFGLSLSSAQGVPVLCEEHIVFNPRVNSGEAQRGEVGRGELQQSPSAPDCLGRAEPAVMRWQSYRREGCEERLCWTTQRNLWIPLEKGSTTCLDQNT